MKKISIICLLAVLAVSCHHGISAPEAAVEKKIEDLLAKMTLDEKIGQMNQLSSSNMDDRLTDAIREGQAGSVLNVVDPLIINEFQRIAVEESRLGIPLLVGRDVIHGFKTVFPIPLGLAATFDPALAEQGARIAAIEATSVGVRWTFSPMLDIARDPRWGRIAEGSGEDTYLTSLMGAALVRGYQGASTDEPTSMAACIKHFVGYGAAEGGRDYNSTFLSERLLRNVYLPPFEAAVKAGALTLMTSFNDNDGVPSTGNTFLLRNILRDEWHFKGFVVSDWSSATEMIAHGFAQDAKEAAALSVNAGVDMDMMSFSFISHLKELVEEGKVSERNIDDAVRNILRVKFQLGLFDSPYLENAEKYKETFYAPEHLNAAKQTVIESAVLLKNDGVLPLDAKKIKTILVTGPMADAGHDQLGTWAFDGDSDATVTPLEALREVYGGTHTIIYEPGLTYSREENPQGIARAVAAARRADVVLAFVGEEAILSGEAHCLANLNLQGEQSDLLAGLKNTGKQVVTVVMAGRALTIGRDLENSNALLFSFHPGTMGGPALADLIFGAAVPSGKLPVTFPKTSGQIPLYYNHNMTGRPYQGNETSLKDIPLRAGQTSLGNTSFYLDAGADPLFPFGFGLSYTSFAYTNVQIDKVNYAKEDTITVSFDLSNTGAVTGTEVAQIYIRDMVGSVTRPVKELKGFTRISLNPGETKSITMKIPVIELAFWDLNMKKTVEPGAFRLWVAGDSVSGEPLTFEIK